MLRLLVSGGPGMVIWSDVDASTADAVIRAEVAYFASLDGGRGRAFEWKLYGHDPPPDLAGRLLAAGFVSEEPETLLLGSTADVISTSDTNGRALDPVTVREVGTDTLDADLAGIGRLQEAVWHEEFTHGRELREQALRDPQTLRIHVAEAPAASGEPLVVSAAWIRFEPGTGFAGLWGGSTLSEWRGRGIYRELVHRRALQAAAAGYPYLQVDASPDSRPILERLGFHAVCETRPYVWTPAP